jgi:hypothetical protein
MRARRWAVVLGIASWVGACGGARPVATRASAPPPASSASASAYVADAGPEAALPSFDVLAVRGEIAAAGLVEASRFEVQAPLRRALPTAERDTCYRALFAADATVRIRLDDAERNALGDEARAAMGLVPARGPACVRAGSTVTLVVEGAGAVRVVVYASR